MNKKLEHRDISRFEQIFCRRLKQCRRLVGRQHTRQRGGRLGRPDTQHRIGAQAAVTNQPAVQTPPGRKVAGDTAPLQPLAMQTGDEAAHVLAFQLRNRAPVGHAQQRLQAHPVGLERKR